MKKESKTERLHIRLTEYEKERLKNAAIFLNRDMSKFVKDLIISKSNEILDKGLAFVDADFQKDIKDLSFEITREKQ